MTANKRTSATFCPVPGTWGLEKRKPPAWASGGGGVLPGAQGWKGFSAALLLRRGSKGDLSGGKQPISRPYRILTKADGIKAPYGRYFDGVLF